MTSSVAPASKMDTFFLGHGSPLVSIDDAFPVRHFYKSWQTESLRDKPKAILLISAHWETTDPCVNSVNRNSTIHDFDGWPEPLYQIQYPAPGAPELAARVKELLKKSGFKNVGEDEERGLDHGAWVPLMLMYPEADVPVCQLSVQSHLDGTHHYNVGRALQPLRDEGVLILGSGAATHNLDVVGHIGVGGPVLPWALDFDTWLRECLVNGRHEDINHYEEKAPHAKLAHPEPEHFYPLHVVLGAGGEKAKAELIHNSWEDATLSYSCYRFSTTK